MNDSSISFIDSHCHLDFNSMGDIDKVIAVSAAQGVHRFVVPSVSHKNWYKVLELSRNHSQISCALGVHPYFIEANNRLDQLASLAREQREHIVAIGEIGLDGAIDCPMETQLQVLKAQLSLAKALDLPIICHAHKAYDVLLKQLRSYRLTRGGVIHGFSGSLVQASAFLSLGFYIGVGGVITYQRSQKTRNVFSQLPLSSLILETDSPDMPLSGQQGQTNHPKNIPLIAQHLAALLNTTTAEVARVTSANANALFD